MQNGHRPQVHVLADHHRPRALVDHDLGAAPHLDLQILDVGQKRRNRRWFARRTWMSTLRLSTTVARGTESNSQFLIDDRSHGLGRGEAGVVQQQRQMLQPRQVQRAVALDQCSPGTRPTVGWFICLELAAEPAA